MELETTSVLNCRTKFSDISIGKLDQKLELVNNYGSFEVDEIPAGFTAISITNSYGNIELGISASAAYSLEADMHFCNLDYNSDNANLHFINESSHDQQLKGTIGSDPAGNVKVSSNYGNVSLEN